MIELKNITKKFKEKLVLNGLSATFPLQETTALIGPSGCGKTTILRLIAGLEKDYSGEIHFFGQSFHSQELATIRKQLGYVIQQGGLFPHLTAKENVVLAAQYYGMKANKTEERFQELVQICHLRPEIAKNYPSQLSGGQMQRVALMRALMLDPPVLLMDEPLGALDPIIRKNLQLELKEVFQKLKKTVIFVTHDLTEAEFIADKIILLKDGKVLHQSKAADLQKGSFSSEFAQEFLSSQKGIES